jgi:hypothetical protein
MNENKTAQSHQTESEINGLLKRWRENHYDPDYLTDKEWSFLEEHRTHCINELAFIECLQKEASEIWSIRKAFRDNYEKMENLGSEIQDDFGKLLKAKSIDDVRTHSHELRSKAINFIASLIQDCKLEDHFQINAKKS